MTVLLVSMAALGVAVLIALIRVVLGPTAFDRVLAVNSIGTIVIIGIALHGFVMERPEFVDIAILYAILNLLR